MADLKHLAFIDVKAIKRAYDPAIREIGLKPWDGFSEENKDQLTMIKFLSLEERISGSQPANQMEVEQHRQDATVDLIKQFEQFRSETQEQMRQMQMKIGALTEENIELRDLISKK